MPKIYDNTKEHRDQRWENHKSPVWSNGPAGPSAQTDNRVNFALIAIVLAFVLVMLLFKYARGEELPANAVTHGDIISQVEKVGAFQTNGFPPMRVEVNSPTE
jgi:hypothetical protein